jgi:hypothetical protein
MGKPTADARRPAITLPFPRARPIIHPPNIDRRDGEPSPASGLQATGEGFVIKALFGLILNHPELPPLGADVGSSAPDMADGDEPTVRFFQSESGALSAMPRATLARPPAGRDAAAPSACDLGRAHGSLPVHGYLLAAAV